MDKVIFAHVSDRGVRVLGRLNLGDESPWGKIDHLDYIADGIYSVSTPSHGGYMFRKDVAAKIPCFPESKGFLAREFGGQWLCFEEDCAAYIAELILDKHFESDYRAHVAKVDYMSYGDRIRCALVGSNAWYPEQARAIYPAPVNVDCTKYEVK